MYCTFKEIYLTQISGTPLNFFGSRHEVDINVFHKHSQWFEKAMGNSEKHVLGENGFTLCERLGMQTNFFFFLSCFQDSLIYLKGRVSHTQKESEKQRDLCWFTPYSLASQAVLGWNPDPKGSIWLFHGHGVSPWVWAFCCCLPSGIHRAGSEREQLGLEPARLSNAGITGGSKEKHLSKEAWNRGRSPAWRQNRCHQVRLDSFCQTCSHEYLAAHHLNPSIIFLK